MNTYLSGMANGPFLFDSNLGQPTTSYHFLRALKKAKEESMKEFSQVDAGRKRLESRIQDFGLRVNEDTDDKGDCQFDAVADQLNRVFKVDEQGQTFTKESVRRLTIEWLRCNGDYRIAPDDEANIDTLKSWINDTQGTSWEEYLERMSKPRIWGDEVTMKGIVEAFQVKVLVWSSTVSEKNYFSVHEPGKKGDYPTLCLCHFLEIHYGSLLNEEDYNAKEEAKKNKDLLDSSPDPVLKVKVLEEKVSLQMKEIMVLKSHLADAQNIIKQLKSEKEELKKNSFIEEMNQKDEITSAVITDEDGKNWLLANYSFTNLEEEVQGDIFELVRQKSDSHSEKVLQRLPYPGTASGSVVFEPPANISYHLIKYMRKGKIICESQQFLWGPKVTMEAQPTAKGNGFQVDWKMFEGDPTTYDWIACYKINEQSVNNYETYQYVKPQKSQVFLKVGNGKWEIKYYSGTNKRFPICSIVVEK